MLSGYLIRRLLEAIPLLLFISILVFGLLKAAPGNPLAAMERGAGVSAEDIQRVEEKLGLNDPLPVQYARWVQGVVRGDLGNSLTTHRPVTEMIAERLPNTLYLMGTAFLITLLIAIPIGILSAVKQYSWFDHFATTMAFIGQSIPVFWLGLILILVFYVALSNPFTGGPLLPAGGMAPVIGEATLLARIKHLILPVTTLALAWVAWYSRFLRSSMLDVLHQDYVRTARSKGLTERTVLVRHTLKNAALPVVTLLALDVPNLFAGALFTETIFSWPGMGRLFLQGALRRDYPLLMGIIMFTAVLIILANLLADVAYSYLDPRVHYGGRDGR